MAAPAFGNLAARNRHRHHDHAVLCCRPAAQIADHARNLGFITTCYLSKHFGPQVTTAYMQNGVAASTTPSARGYISNEAYSADWASVRMGD